MAGRQMISSPHYEHGYQGQYTERDEETGLDAFELRMWDSRLARWTSTDPYGQYHSPYLGMGNNPINGVDPDGGLFGLGANDDKFTMLDDGTIRRDEITTDKFDLLFNTEGILIRKVNKGFLFDGLNIENNGLFVNVLNQDDFISYLELVDAISVEVNKEIGGFFLEDKNDFNDLFIAPFRDSEPRKAISFAAWVNTQGNRLSQHSFNIGGKNRDAVAWFHTHPDILGGGGFSKASAQDIKFTQNLGVPGFIIGGRGGIGFISRDGNKTIRFGN